MHAGRPRTAGRHSSRSHHVPTPDKISGCGCSTRSGLSRISWRTSGRTSTDGGHRVTALRCRIKLYLDQAAPLRSAGPGVSARLCLEGPPGARRATPGSAADQNALYGNADQCAWAVILGSECPARGRRVKIACGVATRSASLDPDSVPAPRGWRLRERRIRPAWRKWSVICAPWRRSTIACASVVAAASTGEQAF
jgi:hypothetical protein